MKNFSMTPNSNWLTTNGHPGYSDDFAKKVWAIMLKNFSYELKFNCELGSVEGRRFYRAMVFESVIVALNGWE